MLELNHYSTYALSMPSQKNLYRKAENQRLAGILFDRRRRNPKKGFNPMGTLKTVLSAILLI